MKERIRFGALFLLFVTAAAAPSPSRAADGAITIGVLTDFSGPFAADFGKGSLRAAQMAVEDFGPTVLGRPIRIVSADHQNKPDVGAIIARRWFDVEGVDAIFDVPNSAVALAVAEVAREKNRVVAFSGPTTATLTGKACAATTSQWGYDTFSLVNGSIKTLIKQGVDTWFFLTYDNDGGKGIERIGTRAINESGGKVLGGVHHAVNTSDFSSYLLAAQASKAKALALVNGGADTINALKQASEFGLPQSGVKMVGITLVINDIDSVGLKTARGTVVAESYYWDLNEATRAWNRRFKDAVGAPANQLQASVYSAVLHYLKAVQKAGTDDGVTVANAMKQLAVNDFQTKDGELRADGRMMRDVFVFEVKSPEESKAPWDYYKPVGRVAAADLYLPLKDSECPLVKK